MPAHNRAAEVFRHRQIAEARQQFTFERNAVVATRKRAMLNTAVNIFYCRINIIKFFAYECIATSKETHDVTGKEYGSPVG